MWKHAQYWKGHRHSEVGSGAAACLKRHWPPVKWTCEQICNHFIEHAPRAFLKLFILSGGASKLVLVRRQGLNTCKCLLLCCGTRLCFYLLHPQHPSRSEGTPSLHTHQRLLSTPSSASEATSHKSVSATPEKGSEIPSFAGMVNVSVRCLQLHSGLFAPNIPIGSGIVEGGRRNWREGRQCRAFPDA